MMKYSIEITDNGCKEVFEFGDKHYECNYTETYEGCRYDKGISEQMEDDGLDDEFIDKYYDAFDSFKALDLIELNNLI